MEVITIESRAFKQLMEKLDALSEYIHSIKRTEGNENEDWVDSSEVCRFLRICERTLQRLRTNGKITYSCVGGKYYYQIGQIKKLLKENLIKSSDDCLRELVEHHRQRTIKKQ